MKEPLPMVYQGLPVVSAGQMTQMDHQASAQYGVPALQLMENAGKAVAEEVSAYFKSKGLATSKSIVICCGKGSNGGDGLVTARYLSKSGFAVSVFICPPKKDKPYSDLVQKNLERAREVDLSVIPYDSETALSDALQKADGSVDALLGTGTSGKPSGAVKNMIQQMMRAQKPIFAIDIPSGLDPNTGYHSGVYIAAVLTLTLGLPKRGLIAPHAQRYVGELKVLDIGYPPALIKEAAAKTAESERR